MLLDVLTVSPAEFSAHTGWDLKPEGACKGDVCVPLPDGAVGAAGVDVRLVAGRLGMPLVGDEGEGLWCLGPESAVTGRALTSAWAPMLELPDLRTGETFQLASLRGQKVLLVAWASW